MLITGRRTRLAWLALLAAGCVTAGPRAEPSPRGPEAVLHFRWRRLLTEPPLLEYKPQEFASADGDGTRVFVGSQGGFFHALRARDGALMWRKRFQGAISSRPLYDAASGVLYVGGDDGVLYALEATNGRERWIYRSHGPLRGHPVLSGGLIYFTNGENRVFALDAQSGAWRWQYDRETPESFTIRGSSSPLVVDGRAYVGFADGTLASLNAQNGEVLWARSLAGDATQFVDVDATPAWSEGMLYASSYAGGVYAVNAADGAVRWRFEVEGAGTVRIDGDRLYFAATKAGLHCLDREGKLIWRQGLAAQGELSAPTLVGDRYLLLSASEGGTYVVDRTVGRLLEFFHPGHGVTAEPSSDGRQVYLLTNTGFFYAFSVI